jgi:hypothetical protein
MKLEHQVCSLDLAKRLKELGVRQESEFYWRKIREGDWMLVSAYETIGQHHPEVEHVRAFTVAELGEMLPSFCRFWRNGKKSGPLAWTGHYEPIDDSAFGELGDTEAEVKAKMLIHLIEKGIVKP